MSDIAQQIRAALWTSFHIDGKDGLTRSELKVLTGLSAMEIREAWPKYSAPLGCHVARGPAVTAGRGYRHVDILRLDRDTLKAYVRDLYTKLLEAKEGL